VADFVAESLREIASHSSSYGAEQLHEAADAKAASMDQTMVRILETPKGSDLVEGWPAPIDCVCDGFVFRSEKDMCPIQISDLERVPSKKNMWSLIK